MNFSGFFHLIPDEEENEIISEEETNHLVEDKMVRLKRKYTFKNKTEFLSDKG